MTACPALTSLFLLLIQIPILNIDSNSNEKELLRPLPENEQAACGNSGFNNINTSRRQRCMLICVLFVIVLQTTLHAQEITEEYRQGFINPPFSAKPRTWWHWTRR